MGSAAPMTPLGKGTPKQTGFRSSSTNSVISMHRLLVQAPLGHFMMNA